MELVVADDSVIAACRNLPRRFRCPRLVPSHPARDLEVTVFDGEVPGLELGWEVPVEGRGSRARNRPARFLHVLHAWGEKYGLPEGGDRVGTRDFGRRRGDLYLVTGFSMHREHLLFVWEEDGRAYHTSLHVWDDLEAAEALLARFVAGVE
ncbi:MAG TPA: hypothetical protein VEA19_02120 [Actinomycetota bacterium]|nr:hypothetical protein [Actinomycetota bacterium]